MTDQLDNLSLFDEPTKPPYTVPRLADYPVPHGLTAVSTFSGGGGSSLGLKQAGWTIPYAVEFIPEAANTYEANFPTTFVDRRDIRQITPDDILNRIGLEPGELDLFEGSPPCSSFSTANRRGGQEARFGSMKVKNYSDGVKQTTDDLFDEWLRLLEGLRPKAVLAENVPSLTHETSHEFWSRVTSYLGTLGYDMRSDIFHAHHYGAATSRPRLVLYGVRRDLDIDWDHVPRRSPFTYTLRDALDTIPDHGPADEQEYVMVGSHTSVYREWHKLQPGESPEGTGFSLIRCAWDKPVPTITATSGGNSAFGVMHPEVCRKFTATEAAWISGFPPDYRMTGDPRQRYERVGRAVPPPVYAAIGRVLARALGGSACAV